MLSQNELLAKLTEKIKDLKEYGVDIFDLTCSLSKQMEEIRKKYELSKINQKDSHPSPDIIKDISVGDICSVDLGVGYPSELWYGHYCYILKETPLHYIVIPCTSIHNYKDDKYHMIIETVIDREICKSVLHISNIRSVDKQRVDNRYSVVKVLTPKSEIREKIFDFLMNQY